MTQQEIDDKLKVRTLAERETEAAVAETIAADGVKVILSTKGMNHFRSPHNEATVSKSKAVSAIREGHALLAPYVVQY